MTEEKIALFEYDSSQEAVINPDHEKLVPSLPKIAIFAFVGDVIDEYAKERGLEPVTYFKTITMNFPVFIDCIDGKEVVICRAPLGSPAAVQFADWLIGYGVETIISTGSCGVLKDIPENVFLVPVKAIRDEGTSFHYLPAGRYSETNPEVNAIIESYFSEKKLPFIEVMTWTTDGFFRETPAKVTARVEEGCTCVDMECAALCACAKFRGARFSQIFFTADSLANTDSYDERDWGTASLRPALEMCIDIVKRI